MSDTADAIAHQLSLPPTLRRILTRQWEALDHDTGESLATIEAPAHIGAGRARLMISQYIESDRQYDVRPVPETIH